MRKLLFFLLLITPVGISAQENEELRDSLKAASELLSYYPDSLELHLKKASWNMQLSQWEYAKNEYDYVINRDPANIAARYYRAYVNERMRRYKFARLDYEAVLMVVPGNFEARLGLALLNQKDSHFTEALDQINSLVSQYPDSAVAYAARAGIEKEKGMLELAEYDYAEAARRDASSIDYRVNRVDLLISLKRKDEAIAELNALVKMGVPKASLQNLYSAARK